MTTDLVPADNMAALEALDPAAQEAAVTHMLTEARSWLAHAKEATDPTSIAHFKAQMATVAEATKQLNLSKEIQMDAQEMVRRAERGVGAAVRGGQGRGEIARVGDIGGIGAPGVHGGVSRSSRGEHLAHPHEVAQEHKASLSAIYLMTDGVTDEHFEEAITEAKAEGNLSRANVVRKIKGEPPASRARAPKADLIRELAGQGYSSRQMLNQVGVSEDTIRDIAREYSIDIPADRIIGRQRRVDSTDVVRNIVAGYEMALAGQSAINWSDVDPTEADEWVNSLTESISAASAFRKQIKELTRD